jgi:hypothetical protein
LHPLQIIGVPEVPDSFTILLHRRGKILHIFSSLLFIAEEVSLQNV